MDTIKRITDLNIPSEILLGNHHNSGNLNTVQQAAIHNRPEVIKRLHKMGISVDQLLMFNKTSSQSYSAVELSVTSNHPDIIKAFSDIGATPKQLDPAAASSILSGPPSRTTTLLAVKNNYTEVLQALIDAGLTENQLLRANNNNERPHYIAAEKGFADALMIVGKALPPKKLFGTKEPHYSDSLLKTAVLGGRHGEGNNQDLINVLCKLDKERAWINKPCAYDNATALILSITKHKNKAMSALIDHLTIDELLTPCQQGRLPLHYAIEAEKYATRPAIKALVDKGIAINDLITVDKYGQSPLHIAVQRDRSNTISFMRSLGMDASALSVTTRIQWSPIHLAARNNSLSALKKLVDCGASKKQLNLAALGLDGGTPLEIAQRHKHTKIVKYLTQILSNENENA